MAYTSAARACSHCGTNHTNSCFKTCVSCAIELDQCQNCGTSMGLTSDAGVIATLKEAKEICDKATAEASALYETTTAPLKEALTAAGELNRKASEEYQNNADLIEARKKVAEAQTALAEAKKANTGNPTIFDLAEPPTLSAMEEAQAAAANKIAKLTKALETAQAQYRSANDAATAIINKRREEVEALYGKEMKAQQTAQSNYGLTTQSAERRYEAIITRIIGHIMVDKAYEDELKRITEQFEEWQPVINRS
jgi:hypothetical protein